MSEGAIRKEALAAQQVKRRVPCQMDGDNIIIIADFTAYKKACFEKEIEETSPIIRGTLSVLHIACWLLRDQV
jgi:hypothetical protein